MRSIQRLPNSWYTPQRGTWIKLFAAINQLQAEAVDRPQRKKLLFWMATAITTGTDILKISPQSHQYHANLWQLPLPPPPAYDESIESCNTRHLIDTLSLPLWIRHPENKLPKLSEHNELMQLWKQWVDPALQQHKMDSYWSNPQRLGRIWYQWLLAREESNQLFPVLATNRQDMVRLTELHYSAVAQQQLFDYLVKQWQTLSEPLAENSALFSPHSYFTVTPATHPANLQGYIGSRGILTMDAMRRLIQQRRNAIEC